MVIADCNEHLAQKIGPGTLGGFSIGPPLLKHLSISAKKSMDK
jgi:hypothetical protein